MSDKSQGSGGKKEKAKFLDLCVPVVFASTGKMKVCGETLLKIPSAICNVKCEHIAITKRSVAMDCDNVFLCVEFDVCYRFIPLLDPQYHHNYKVCIKEAIPKNRFKRTDGRTISPEDFLDAEGACVHVSKAKVPKTDCQRNVSCDGCESIVKNIVKFILEVKLFREHNLTVVGFCDKPVDRLPIEICPCV